MVAGLAFLATAIATVFAQATGVRWSKSKATHEGVWTFALALFALASAALSVGVSTQWDNGTFRAFYLLGAILNVPWLALGTIYLLFGKPLGDKIRYVLLVFTGIAIGVMMTAPIHPPIAATAAIPVGKDHFGVFPRVLAAVASGVGALVVFAGAAWSSWRFARKRTPGSGSLAGGNALIALGTLILASGGLLQGVVGADESFTISLAAGIAVIYAGFVVCSGVRFARDGSSRRTSLPASVRGNASTTSTRVGSL